MNRIGLVILLLLWPNLLVWSQSGTLITEDQELSVDSVHPSHITTHSQNDSVVQPTTTIHYLSGVRDMRDSLRQAVRIARDSMRMDITDLRMSVRSNLRSMARQYPHELRIGWGDQMFESLVWYSKPYYTIYPEWYSGEYNENYRYTQHWFAEYQYRIRHWYNIGGMIDYSGVLWDKVTRNGKGDELFRESNQDFHNITILLTMHFTYLHSKYVSLYSGLGMGLNINTGSEIDYLGRYTALAPAINLTVLGMSVGNARWFGAVEFGGLYALTGQNEIYLASSRMFTASVGYRL